MQIAMWSGPRNLSTALMYAFAARGDCLVRDEPFYAAYLAATGAAHPMRDAVIATGETDPAAVADEIAALPGAGADHAYLKLMPHHMVPGFPLDWAKPMVHVHLIRHPARVIASYAAKRAEVTLDEIGFPQQMRLFEALPGPVIDSAQIRADPQAALARLCAEIGLPFTPAMLHWAAGPKPYDGAWAAHWYGAVHRSTGFAAPEGPVPVIAPAHRDLLAEALPFYEYLSARAVVP